MRPIKKFEDFIQENIVKKRVPDNSRAISLRKEAENSELFLNNIINCIGISNMNANEVLKMIYDILMGLIRSCINVLW